MNCAAPAEPKAKVASIQALRAIAALTVAVVHLAGGFARHIDSRLAWLPPGDQLAQAAVAVFFVVSRCVMVLSSDRLFGSRRGVPVFWWRRAARVLPPYWIATGLLAAVAVALGQTIEFGEVARSLAFIGTPSANISGAPFELFLWPGWSLFYELLFYALFGTFVALGRVLAVTATSAVLVLLVLAGTQVSPDFLPAYAATRPIVLLFVAGMVFGLALGQSRRAPRWLRWGAAAAAIASFVLVPPPAAPLGLAYLAWAGLPAVLVFFAVIGGPRAVAAMGGFAGRRKLRDLSPACPFRAFVDAGVQRLVESSWRFDRLPRAWGAPTHRALACLLPVGRTSVNRSLASDDWRRAEPEGPGPYARALNGCAANPKWRP